MNGSLIGFYVKQWGSRAVIPSAGLYEEDAKLVGIYAQLPVQQRILGGLVKANNRLTVHLSRMF